jgi:molecular chaperone GrpE
VADNNENKELQEEEATTENATDEAVSTDDNVEASDNAENTEAPASEEEANDTQAEAAETDEQPEKEIKKNKKFKKKDKRDEEIAELKDRVTRNLAEFDNFRKRTEKEKSQMFDLGAKSMIEKILPVIDNFERGLATLDEKGLEEPFAAGIEKTYKQLVKTLEDAGVTPIEAVGNEFNPELHNAVMHVDDEGFGENTVCEEFQKGYMYKDAVVRHSMVKVAN